MSERCPNCDVEFVGAKFSDLQTEYNFCYDVWIIYCPECGYVHDCYTN